MKHFLAIALASMIMSSAAAQDRMVTLEVRPGVKVYTYLMKREGAKATVLLLTGGEGGIAAKNGVPTSQNFLVRSRDLFAEQGFNVAVMSRPSDVPDMKGDFRTSSTHMEDLTKVIAQVKRELGEAPVWLVGTSRGTISATAAAIRLGSAHIAGIVLTSSIIGTDHDFFQRKAFDDGSSFAVVNQDLAAIRIPVLVVHHRHDACRFCAPSEVPRIERGLKNAPVKKTVFIETASEVRGDPCEPHHYHGFIGAEKETVAIIANWIRKPN